MNDYYDAYDYQSVSSPEFPTTQTTDLPVAWESDWPTSTPYSGTSAQPQVSEIPRSSGIDLTGILRPITATAESFLNLYGKVAQISTSAATMSAQREMDKSRIDLQRVQVGAATDIAKTQATSAADIARIQAATAVEKQAQILSSTKGGVFTAQQAGPSLLVLAGIGVSLWAAFRGSKK